MNEKLNRKLIETLIYGIFLICMVIVFSYKCNYHIDEMLTYSLSNQNRMFSFEMQEGEVFIPSEKPFIEILTVSPKHRFDYSNVWHNQSKDVHPPFYYVLIHTICSFFPGTFSPWFAGSINFVFALFTLFMLRKLSYYFLDSSFLINCITLAFIFSAGILSTITFLRMYVVSMFWVTLLSYYYVKELNDNTYGNDKSFLLKISLITLFGALTHYYCILYATLISVLYGLYLLLGKKWKETGCFCFAMVSTGIISYFVFPAMLYHIFLGHRGQQVLTNAKKVSDFFDRVKDFWQIMNSQLFGNFGFLLIIIIMVLLVLTIKEHNQTFLYYLDFYKHKLFLSYLFILIPVISYFLIVSKITIFRTDRYLVPIYAISFWSVVVLLINLIHRQFTRPKANIAALLILCAITAGSWMYATWPYLYLESKPFIDKAANYTNSDYVCIYNSYWWDLEPSYSEVKHYKSSTFIHVKNDKYLALTKKISEKINNENPDKMILSITGIPPNEHKKYINSFPQFSFSQKLGAHYISTSYLLSK